MYKDYEIKLNAILDKHKGVQKVELGIADDMLKSVNNLKNNIKEIKKGLKNTNVSLNNLKKSNKDLAKNRSSLDGTLIKAEKLDKELLKLADKLRKSAKDLGVNVNEIPAYDKWLDLDTSVIDNARKEEKDILKIINKIGI